MKRWKKKIAVLLGIACITIMLVRAAAEPVRAAEKLTGKTAWEVTGMMGVGFNIGNTFDATGFDARDLYGHEESWGNPRVTKQLVDSVAATGFKTLRIPITWMNEISYDGKYTIRPEFLARIKEVVDYAYDNDMFVIINVHHENWVNRKDLDTQYREVGNELAAIWSQLADYFADYDQHLIFEALNEPRMAETPVEWTGTEEGYSAVNYLDQVFADAIRSNGKGQNPERCLMIPQYAASCSSNVMGALSLPTFNGEVVNNLIVSVHSYTPYDFCLSDKSADFDLNNTSHTGGVDTVFASINNLFLSKGIPVVMGETGATNTKDNTEARENWASYTASKAASFGVPVVIWDNGAYGNSGGECHAWINRENGEWNYPSVVTALINAANETEWGSALESNSTASEKAGSIFGFDSSSIIWQKAEGLASKTEWDYTYIQLGAKPEWVTEGRDVYMVFSGQGEPKLVLDSEQKQVWWIPVDPDSIEVSGDVKIAKFSYDTILAQMKANGVDNGSQLRYFSVLAANGGITMYEIGCLGGSAVVTFKANGKTVAMGSETPEALEVPGMRFAGWYSTIDYRQGTEFDEKNVSSDMTVYAKYEYTGEFPQEEEPEKKEINEEDIPPIFRQNNKDKDKKEPTATPEPSADDAAIEKNGQEINADGTASMENEAGKGLSVSEEETGENKNGNVLPAVILIAGGAVLAVLSVIIIKKRKKK